MYNEWINKTKVKIEREGLGAWVVAEIVRPHRKNNQQNNESASLLLSSLSIQIAAVPIKMMSNKTKQHTKS